MAGSFFCEHRRLLTTCADCRQARIGAFAAMAAERPRPVELPSGRAPRSFQDEDRDEAPAQVRGPGKPLMPTRKRARKATAQDVANAEAWWVKKD